MLVINLALIFFFVYPFHAGVYFFADIFSFGLVWFYGISTFVGYLTPNPFLCKSDLFKTIHFSMATQFNCQKHFYFKLFKQLYIIIHFGVSTVSMSKTVQFPIIQFNINTQFKCKYSLIVKNISI